VYSGENRGKKDKNERPGYGRSFLSSMLFGLKSEAFARIKKNVGK
jgi:hypothetical protein